MSPMSFGVKSNFAGSFALSVAVPTFHLLVSALPRTFQPVRSLPLKSVTAFSSAAANAGKASRVIAEMSQRFMESLLGRVKGILRGLVFGSTRKKVLDARQARRAI